MLPIIAEIGSVLKIRKMELTIMVVVSQLIIKSGKMMKAFFFVEKLKGNFELRRV